VISLPELNLPAFEPQLLKKEDQVFIFDFLRKKHLVLTPEEWVRQHCINYLVNHKNYLKGRLASEYALKIGDHTRRCDLLYFDEFGKPLLIVECKATSVLLDEKTFLQTSNYVASTGARFFWMTNGLQHVIVDCIDGINYIEEIPNL
jgi:hypothetical protein